MVFRIRLQGVSKIEVQLVLRGRPLSQGPFKMAASDMTRQLSLSCRKIFKLLPLGPSTGLAIRTFPMMLLYTLSTFVNNNSDNTCLSSKCPIRHFAGFTFRLCTLVE